jgi:phenylacetate-CoA ligase
MEARRAEPSLWEVVARARAIRRHPRLGREALLRFQADRLQQLIARACASVPYYRQLFDRHGLVPGDVRTPADLARVPVTPRRALQELPLEQITARGADLKELRAHWTCGSSGRPLTIRRTPREDRVLDAVRLRAMAAYGLRWRDVKAVIKSSTAVTGHQPAWRRRLRRELRGTINQFVDCHLPLPEIVSRLRELRPAIVEGYATVLARIARQVDPRELRALRLRFVTSGGEVLTPAMRAQISAAFGVPVFDVYASEEFNLLAWQCPHGDSYHVSDDGLILEVLRDDGSAAAQGERGIVVGTALHSHAMPFIRYELGDIAMRGPQGCACGAPFSTITEIQGRMIDQFPLPDGRLVHPYQLLTPIGEAFPWIREFQVTQLRADRLVIRLAARPHPPPAEVSRVREMARAALGPGVQLELEVLPEIPLEDSGKFRIYRSHVYSDYEGIQLRR